MQPKLISISSIFLFIIIVLLPLIYIFGESIIKFGTISIESYKVLLMDSRQLILLINSLLLAFGTVCLSIVIGIPLGFLIARTDVYFKRSLKYLYLVPLVIPPYIHAIVWIDLLGQQGAINLFLMRVLALQEPVLTIYGFVGAIWVLTLSYCPLITLLTISGLSSIGQQLEEAGRLTKTEFGVSWGITAPLIAPFVVSGAILVFVFALSNYGVPALLRVNVYPIEIFAQFSAYYDSRSATALTLPVVFISIHCCPVNN